MSCVVAHIVRMLDFHYYYWSWWHSSHSLQGTQYLSANQMACAKFAVSSCHFNTLVIKTSNKLPYNAKNSI